MDVNDAREGLELVDQVDGGGILCVCVMIGIAT